MTGAGGDDLRLEAPVGTIIRNAETGDVLADLTEAGAGSGGIGRRARRPGQHPLRHQPLDKRRASPSAASRARNCG